MTALASIDIGTNTIRMIILESGPNGDLREVDSERAIVRLGEGLHTEKRLLPHRIEQAIRVLKGFVETCRRCGNVPIHAVATSAVREAKNREEFLDRIQADLGMEIQVIPWEEEARLTLEGGFWKIHPKGKRTLIFDIGGGSTEFSLSEGKMLLGTGGTALGVVSLTERFITRHPVDPEEYRDLQDHLREELGRIRGILPAGQVDQMIGTAGTVTTLAAIDQDLFPYDPLKIHETHLSRDRIETIQADLKSKSIEERQRIKPLERGREDLIVSGIAIVLETMEAFECGDLTVSEFGLREGIILNHLKNIKKS